MTWGQGYGLGWNSDPLVALETPTSRVSEPPTVFRFDDEPDGPLPGTWEPYRLTTDGATVTGEAEPSGDTFYRVSGGLGLWAFERSPVSGSPYLEQGVAASPSAALEGRNGRVAAYFVNPLGLRDRGADEFVFEVTVGLRVEDEATRFVGGRVQAIWTPGGGWAPAAAVEAVQGAGGPVTVLAAATLPELGKPTDLWSGDMHELAVEVREGVLTVTFGGWISVTAAVPATGPAKAFIGARIYNRTGTLIQSAPAFIGVELQSLRDMENLGPTPDVPGDISYDAPLHTTTRELPWSVLCDTTLWQRFGARLFRAKVEQTHNVRGTELCFDAGDTVRATEKVVGQAFVPIVPALSEMRSRPS